jgi:hypothetical protein
VWPAARVAAHALQKHVSFVAVPPRATATSTTKKLERQSSTNSNEDVTIRIRSMCELGCGPGLPSLTAAAAFWAAGAAGDGSLDPPDLLPRLERVVATDADPLALELVRAAAREQGVLGSILTTQIFDLVRDTRDDGDDDHRAAGKNDLPAADLYVLSDVFESAEVARGAARLTARVLLNPSGRRRPAVRLGVRAVRPRPARRVRGTSQGAAGRRQPVVDRP